MRDRPEWFNPHFYGMGTGWPIAWQGWALSVAMIASVLVAWWLFGEDDPRALAIIIPAIVGYLVVAARTTKGGWRWRWGRDDGRLN